MALLTSMPRRVVQALGTIFLLLASPAAAQTVRASASDVQAVFLFNFAQFVEWPAEAFSGPDAPLVIGVLGDDPFGNVLDQTVKSETVRGHPFKIRRFRRIQDINPSHILFIGRSEANRLGEILAAVKDQPVLTVSNSVDFDSEGGIIRFIVEKSRIRLSIDLEAAQATRLTFSSKLLRSASVVSAPAQRP